MVHFSMRIWDKSGNEKMNIFLSDFFNIKKPYSLADPIVLYDHSTEKWFSVIMEISPRSNNGQIERCYYDCFLKVAVLQIKIHQNLGTFIVLLLVKIFQIILWLELVMIN